MFASKMIKRWEVVISDTTRFTFDYVDSQPRKMGVRVKLGLTWVDQHIHLASGEAELELKFKTFSCKKGSSSVL